MDNLWRIDLDAAKTRLRVLLTVEVGGVDRVVVGGWDDHWSGKCWVYENSRVPVGSTPSAWQEMPAPHKHS